MVSTKDSREFGEQVFDTSDCLEDAIDWVSSRLTPEDVFHVSDLEEWALDNGYVLEEQ